MEGKPFHTPQQTRNPLSAFAFSPPGVTFETQDDSEEIILLLRRHWVTNSWWVFLTGVVLLIPPFLPTLLSLSGFDFWAQLNGEWRRIVWSIWYLLASGFAFSKFLNWYFNVYIVTNERIIDVDFHGILFKKISESHLSRVQDITHRVGGLFPILFDYGELMIKTAAEESDLEFERVPHPSQVHRIIGDLIQEESMEWEK